MDAPKAAVDPPVPATKRGRGPPRNEGIWQYFTKLKDAGKYHNYWYVECKSCRAAYVEHGAADPSESNIPAPHPIVSRIQDMHRHLSECRFVSDYVPDDTTSPRPAKVFRSYGKGEKKSTKYTTKGGSNGSSTLGISDKEDKELLRRDMEHRWDMERRRMALEEQKNARIDQKLARQEEEAQINRRLLLAKAQEAELQLKVAQAKARHELLQAGMTPEDVDAVLSNPATTPSSTNTSHSDSIL
ncbi:hypothetical protein H310_08900 [Aphanomyces invadans]|uniref:BED-type domain-containing protein n=1 Tax=Aphanomyces invadans TaxID=157072 RepID=A0A024TX04_9STRA|nr:hypothetical protein H310_08900 [Aphanomyces invadans]ETV98171.1 hypothetical protein H310_08900 [Aphanomyces invadans]|eukprot:XP_008873046.1 hypothetical protein H310_08900 [Aphanomyces invadans]